MATTLLTLLGAPPRCVCCPPPTASYDHGRTQHASTRAGGTTHSQWRHYSIHTHTHSAHHQATHDQCWIRVATATTAMNVWLQQYTQRSRSFLQQYTSYIHDTESLPDGSHNTATRISHGSLVISIMQISVE